MLYELRQYKVNSGKMKQWVKLAEEQIIPFQTSHGMVVPGSFTAVKDTRMFVWLRRFSRVDLVRPLQVVIDKSTITRQNFVSREHL